MSGKIIDTTTFISNTENILQIIADKVCELVPYTEDEIGNLLEISPEQVKQLTAVINDTIVAKNKVFSSAHTEKLVQDTLIEANEYSDHLIKDLVNIQLEVVDILPEIGETNIIYILKNVETNVNTLNVFSSGRWIEVGDLNIELNKYYTADKVDNLLSAKADDDTVVHHDNVVDNLDEPSSTTILSTLALKEKLDEKTTINDLVSSKETTYSSEKIDSLFPDIKLFNRENGGLIPHADITGWYTNTRIEKNGKFCNGYFNVTWNNNTSTRVHICTLSEEVRPSDTIACNCVTNQGAAAYIYFDENGVVGVAKPSTAKTDGIRLPITYFTN